MRSGKPGGEAHQRMGRISVLLCDELPVVLNGLSAALSAYPDIEIVGTTVDGAEGLQMVSALQPAVVVTDFSLTGMSGLELARHIVRMRRQLNGPRVLLFSAKMDDPVVCIPGSITQTATALGCHARRDTAVGC